MDNMIFAKNIKYSTDCNATGTNNNVLVMGGSGSGKTMSIVEPRFLETNNSSLIVTVTKRRLVHKYSKMFNERGYRVFDLNFINPEESNIAYDPLEYISGYSDITFLAKSIIKANHREGTSADPYWDEAGTSLLSSLIAYVIAIEENPNFSDVLDLFSELKIKENGKQIETTIDDKFNSLEERDPNCFAISCWKTFRYLPIVTASCVFSTLSATIDTIFTPELKKMIRGRRKINFESIASEKTVLFISSSAVNPSLHSFINMFYAQAIKQLFEFAEQQPEGKLPVPVTIIADDFATGGRILNFAEYISIFREKQISVMLLVQSESQLESIYGYTDTTTIIDNCDSIIYLGGMSIKTARSISERINLPLEDVLNMPVGQVMVFHRGQKPVLTSRYDIFEDKRYKKITRDFENQIKTLV